MGTPGLCESCAPSEAGPTAENSLHKVLSVVTVNVSFLNVFSEIFFVFYLVCSVILSVV